ncbi:MAG: VOC family protein [Blastocatellia bacterium]|nr:VOC family protein [Blastocatellia bacterium]
MSNVNPIPNGFHTVTPHLVLQNASEVIEFYKKAFGAEECGRMMGPDGQKVMHAEIKIGNSMIMVGEEHPEMGFVSPLTTGQSGVTIHLYVPDVDAVFEQAVQAGATVKMPVTDMFWGDRYGMVVDPSGHNWSLATHTRDVSFEEMKQAMAASDCH